ncbi:MAG: hypothetical protein LC792_02840 [Actinobacteria bacterium]|nr:hypothetical protein [Actinomycetota bacterium]
MRASLLRLPFMDAAIFPNDPERAVYNNAVLAHGCQPIERAAALDAMESAYAAAGVDQFRAWIHETDVAMRADLERRGYHLAETTRAMGMDLGELPSVPPAIELGPPEWSSHLALLGMPAGFLDGVDEAVLRVAVVRGGDETIATGLAFDFDGDCGIYNVTTVEPARRRGLATAMTAVQLHGARRRGCTTASLQATAMAERVYAAVGFRDLGRILEFAPGHATTEE